MNHQTTTHYGLTITAEDKRNYYKAMTTKTKTEKPILFSTELVQAILDGRKTQTRRVINPQPDSRVNTVHPCKNAEWEFGEDFYNGYGEAIEYKACPYGQPEDELWVRETWQALQHGSYDLFDCKPSDIPEQYADVRYKAEEGEVEYPWKPSIFMPRWASRIQLSVEDIRIERVQEITEKDAKAEGVTLYDNHDGTKGGHAAPMSYKESFSVLWDKINADRGYSWKSNPWVWVVEFSIKNIRT